MYVAEVCQKETFFAFEDANGSSASSISWQFGAWIGLVLSPRLCSVFVSGLRLQPKGSVKISGQKTDERLVSEDRSVRTERPTPWVGLCVTSGTALIHTGAGRAVIGTRALGDVERCL